MSSSSHNSNNNMDGVPVKIAEQFRPPPRLYQLPQAIQQKLTLPADYFEVAPQYQYHFQLENKVLQDIPKLRLMRQQAREALQKRKEKWEKLRLKEEEAQHKRLLGAVSYPSAAELSSTDSEDEEQIEKETTQKEGPTTDDMERYNIKGVGQKQNDNVIPSTQTSSFHNILQPTILSGSPNVLGTYTNSNNPGKNSLFNFEDFENDTSSPFDNMELKTINELDELAKVLNTMQLNAATEKTELIESKTKEDEVSENGKTDNKETIAEASQRIEENSNETTAPKPSLPPIKQSESELSFVTHHRSALEKVDFNSINQQFQTKSHIPATNTFATPLQDVNNSYDYQLPYQLATTQHAAFMPYQLYNGAEQRRMPYTNFNANQNYLYSNSTNCNDLPTMESNVYYTMPSTNLQSKNANNYMQPNVSTAAPSMRHSKLLPSFNNTNNYISISSSPIANKQLADSTDQTNFKSKSVPDILKELSAEVRNSELRRTRNYSHTLEDADALAGTDTKTSPTSSSKTVSKPPSASINSCPYYAKLEVPEQKLAEDISKMGFPLERVAKLAQTYGMDDKKIVEHLITLSELMDLGFDENKISEALLKYDNNKEKALEYLIS